MSVVMMIPAILFVLLVQRNLVRGLTLGATKG
jgi:ABC-type glycerol-3-phosphate transport system permease component